MVSAHIVTNSGAAGMTPEEAAAMRKQMEEEIRAQLEANASAMADMQAGEDRVKILIVCRLDFLCLEGF